MTIAFYPHLEDAETGSLDERIEMLMAAAEKYKAAILDTTEKPALPPEEANKLAPRDLQTAYHWDAIASVLSEIRALPEATKAHKIRKGQLLAKLAEIYEVLRAAKMPKLEAVRLALVNEKQQLIGK